jgi:hypothetical protein
MSILKKIEAKVLSILFERAVSNKFIEGQLKDMIEDAQEQVNEHVAQMQAQQELIQAEARKRMRVAGFKRYDD